MYLGFLLLFKHGFVSTFFAKFLQRFHCFTVGSPNNLVTVRIFFVLGLKITTGSYYCKMTFYSSRSIYIIYPEQSVHCQMILTKSNLVQSQSDSTKFVSLTSIIVQRIIFAQCYMFPKTVVEEFGQI